MLLSLDTIHAGYQEVAILNGLSLHVAEAETVAIVGANGAGKSTAMKAIFGMLNIFSGSIHFQKRNITGLNADKISRLGIAYVPQVNNVFADLTVEENLQMGAFHQVAQQTAIALQQVYELFPDLINKRKVAAETLSGGQRQMLAMARALMVQPKLLLLDEPTAGLSPKYMQQIFTIIKRIKHQGIGVLLVEQHAKQALQCCDRGYVLALGKNRYTGSGEELLSNREIVASFLGG